MDVKIELPDPLLRERDYFLSRVWDIRNDVLDTVGHKFVATESSIVVEAVDLAIDSVLSVIDGKTEDPKQYLLLPREFVIGQPNVPNLAGDLAKSFDELFLAIND